VLPVGVADVYKPADAIATAARYLCDHGAQRDLQAAIFAYTRATWYVQEVLAQAHREGALTSQHRRAHDAAAPPRAQRG
jgi:membrane-bound lytic murein transglycosylase B